MAIVAIVAVAPQPGVEHPDEDGFWPNGMWTATPVLTGGTWRWLVELRRGGQLIKRRTVHRICGA